MPGVVPLIRVVLLFHIRDCLANMHHATVYDRSHLLYVVRPRPQIAKTIQSQHSIYDMLHDDPEFDTLRLNSVVVSRVPHEVITIDDLEEGEWTDEEPEEDKAYRNIQELKISEIATGSILPANRCEAHLDGGSQASTTNDKSALWGFKSFTKKNPC